MKAFLTRALVFAFPCVAIAQIASLQIKVLEGEGAAHPAGAHISRPLTVQVTDDTGQPVAGAAVSFQLPPEGPSGLFSNGLRTDLAITDAAGHATIHSIQLNRNGGQFHIRITVVKEQARAGIISFQYINDKTPTPVVPATPAAPPVAAAPPASATPPAPAEPSAERSAEPIAPAPAEHSAGITPTTAKMGPRIGKKWIVLAVVVVVAAGAALAVSRASSSKSSTVSSSVVSVGTPTITIGNPNP
jgi:hypothetical protein